MLLQNFTKCVSSDPEDTINYKQTLTIHLVTIDFFKFLERIVTKAYFNS